jgi:23S rRNA (cytosine1962-C5)-methyltransferase
MEDFPRIILKPGKEQSLLRFHPWVFSGAIKSGTSGLNEGDIVKVYSNNGEFLAWGHFQIGSIAVRLFSFEPVTVDSSFWRSKLEKALMLREQLGLLNNKDTNVFRLINGEGDGMPGLIVDYYNGTAVFQMHSIGMYQIKNQLANILKELMQNKLSAVYDKSATTLPFKANTGAVDGYIFGNNDITEVQEYGNRFSIDWEEGQKTGFFIDQRENRRLLEHYAQGKDVLNMFGYTGGFSIYALKGKANMVHTVDSSQKAIALADNNVNLNFGDITSHESFAVDAWQYLNDIKDRYNLIVLDPPAFAKHNEALRNALQAYKRLNAAAIKQIRSGGILFTFSCSQVVDKEKFRQAVFSGAALAGRPVKIIHQLSQPADHPIDIYHPEGEYLKGLVLYVE